jgi:hypothetical protein
VDKAAYKHGALIALSEFTKTAVPLWAYPAAAGIGAIGGALTGETPGIGALQGAVLAPATLLGGHAAWSRLAKSAPAVRTLGALGGGLATGAGTYGLGRFGLGEIADLIRAPGRQPPRHNPYQFTQ